MARAPFRFEGKAGVEQLLEGLDALEARCRARRWARALMLLLAIALFASIVPMAVVRRGEPLGAIALGFVVLIARAFVAPRPRERITMAREILCALAAPADASVALAVDLEPTMRDDRRIADPREHRRRARRRPRPSEASDVEDLHWENTWLSLHVTLPDSSLRVARRERVHRRGPAPNVRATFRFDHATVDELELALPEPDGYRAAGHLVTRDALGLDDYARIEAFDASPNRLHVVVASYQRRLRDPSPTGDAPSPLDLVARAYHALGKSPPTRPASLRPSSRRAPRA